MAKKTSEFICQSCGSKYLKWTGRCTSCGEWDSIIEQAPVKDKKRSWVECSNKPEKLEEINQEMAEERWKTDVFEFDRVVGGGIVRGSFGLLGGTPGVGKSTLILQLLAKISRMNKKVIYISGEESSIQIKNRASRLNIQQKDMLILIESCVENILATLHEFKPEFVVIDSIQTLYSDQLSSAAGSVSQVRETASLIMQHAKQTDTAAMLIGHVTKDGDIAGPRTLEHMVDYVLYLEGDKNDQNRILRSVKNRFGTVNEVGLFKMTGKGLSEISKSSTLFVNRFNDKHPGTAIFPAYEGSRSLFLEIQLLVGDTHQNYPVRTAMGLERNRLQVIVAVLEKHLEMDFSRYDIYVNVAGGFRVIEPAIDLAVTAALISSHLNNPLPTKTIFMGEIALTGELRSIPAIEERLYEAARCGFKQAYIPGQYKKSLPPKIEGLKVVFIDDVQTLLEGIQ